MSHPKDAEAYPMIDAPVSIAAATPLPRRRWSFGALSIRTFLSLVITLMGAALLAVVGTRMVAEAERSAQAQDVASLARLGQSLLPALISSRIERGTVIVATMASDPAPDASWQRLAKYRPIADGTTEESLAALATTPVPGAATLAAALAAAHEKLLAIRPAIDAAIRLPRAQRDPDVLARYHEISADYVLAITNAADAVEQATALFDPEIDRLIFLNRQAAAARNYTSLITLRMETADAFDLPWRPEDVIAAAEDHGRADLAWLSVQAVAAGPNIPTSLLRAVGQAKVSAESADAKRQQQIIARLQAGQPGDMPVAELQQLDTGLIDPINEVLRVSTAEIVARATRYQQEARVSVAVTAALLATILGLTTLGIAVVHWRVSAPIRRITLQMARLKNADSGVRIEDEFEADIDRNDEIGEMARALVVFRRQVEEHGRRLQEHEMRRFLETLIDAMPVSITFKDKELRYRYANRSRREALSDAASQSSPAIIGKRLSDVMTGAAAMEIEDNDRAVLMSGEPQHFEQERRGPDGRLIVTWSVKTPFHDAEGRVQGIITCGVDITRLKETEAELVAQREKAEAANRAKSAFLASMSHELRTPLNAIIGFADTLAQGYLGDLRARQQDYVGDIRSSGEHLLKLVNDLLDLSSLEIGRQVLVPAECGFDRIAAAALSMVQSQADRAGIRLDFVPTAVVLHADERAVTQILVNLLGNAIKFSPPGGHIALRAQSRSDGVWIEVEDTGYGMTEEQRKSALSATLVPGLEGKSADPYKTRPKGGAGLGLAICRRLIEQHQGTLEIESESGRGSTVRVMLPAA
jgi:PAS domain S-box-containing protein